MTDRRVRESHHSHPDLSPFLFLSPLLRRSVVSPSSGWRTTVPLLLPRQSQCSNGERNKLCVRVCVFIFNKCLLLWLCVAVFSRPACQRTTVKTVQRNKTEKQQPNNGLHNVQLNKAQRRGGDPTVQSLHQFTSSESERRKKNPCSQTDVQPQQVSINTVTPESDWFKTVRHADWRDMQLTFISQWEKRQNKYNSKTKQNWCDVLKKQQHRTPWEREREHLLSDSLGLPHLR